MIQLEKVKKYYGQDDNKLWVLKDISLKIQEGEFTAIMGPSGSGKSSLMNTISFLDGDFSGDYFFNGEQVYQYDDKKLSLIRNSTVGFVFQSFNLIENYTAYENVELPLLYSGCTHKEVRLQVTEMLEKVGIGDKGNNLPKQLSGGQQQRVAIARALINQPKFIVADEPTGALDTKTSDEILTLFKQLNEENGVTILMVTHDQEAANYCSRVIDVRDGLVVG
ncbi:ABC transporter ATP-binding protein [Enterococcus caccae]|uniref:ABC transporter ATP-binding protein n=1 Tax=Enterococcus caccae ATCC BAA-1240 TaxID=1158612 RepID=R3TSN1_9ENTE|nr:ABC transporter ATP-binding protein [Enterococcus caccae]EOL44564.1 ABC transporter ATP-binding protein [Enterococcus caccae ATCC BAA-1240]EOT58707.1 ABC transporter ATP-binding protein [Enterococcus caccae ATCC BAA-1240]